jgi:hypothetical protein
VPELLRRVHRVDALRCEPCGGRVTVLAVITDRGVIAAILTCLGPPASAPPIAPARDPPATDRDPDLEDRA